MNNTPNARKSSQKTASSNAPILNPLTLILFLAIIICSCYVVVHIVDRWDGHLHDTRGCTSLQSMNGKVYKVNSCDSVIEQIDIPLPSIPLENVPRNPIPSLTQPEEARPQYQLPPSVSPQLPLPSKKPAVPKTPEPPKPAPYMI
jgi:hypothetical protein